MIIYLIGVIIATILIGRALCRRNTGNECPGSVLCYLFALASWVIVILLAIIEIYEKKWK